MDDIEFERRLEAWPEEPYPKDGRSSPGIKPAVAKKLSRLLNLAGDDYSDDSEALEAIREADQLIMRSGLSWQELIEPSIVRRPPKAVCSSKLNAEAVPVEQHGLADERNICAVMKTMAPLLLKVGVLVEFEVQGTNRLLSLTTVERS